MTAINYLKNICYLLKITRYIHFACTGHMFKVLVEKHGINSEPEELTIGISELDDIENKIDLEVISKEINRRVPQAG